LIATLVYIGEKYADMQSRVKEFCGDSVTVRIDKLGDSRREIC